MDSASAAAAESAPAEETQQSAYPDEFLPEGEEETLDPYFEESAEEKLSLDDLLFFLGGIETELDPAERNLSPFFLIDTDGGVLEIYRYNNSLYFYDPHTGIPCEASCSESALVRYLQN